MADAAEQATIELHRVTAAKAALQQPMHAEVTVEPKPGLFGGDELDESGRGFVDACTLLGVYDAAKVARIRFVPGAVQITLLDPDLRTLTLEVVEQVADA